MRLWQSRKRVGCFICLKIRQRNTKTAQYRKGLFSKDFWTILMMLIKIRIIRNLISVLLADHITVRIPNWGLDWWQRGFIVLIEVTCFFPRPMYLYLEMFPLLASICWGYAELISFRRTNTGWIILFIFIPFLPSFGELGTIWVR